MIILRNILKCFPAHSFCPYSPSFMNSFQQKDVVCMLLMQNLFNICTLSIHEYVPNLNIALIQPQAVSLGPYTHHVIILQTDTISYEFKQREVSKETLKYHLPA